MKHLTDFDAFSKEHAHLYESTETDRDNSDDPTLYESITERAYGAFTKRTDAKVFAHSTDDAFLQDLADLANVNDDDTAVNYDKTFEEMLTVFNAYYSVDIKLPDVGVKNIIESMSAWYEKNEENITPETFKEEFESAVMLEKKTVAEENSEIPAICKKKVGSLTSEEEVMLYRAILRARGTSADRKTLDKLTDRHAAEMVEKKKKAPKHKVVEPSKEEMDRFENMSKKK